MMAKKDPLKVKTPLSNKLTVAIRQVVADVKACEKDKRYDINMNMWHTPNPYSPGCEVCAAGAAMARRTDALPDQIFEPLDFDNAEMFKAIDDIRDGDIYTALYRLGFEMSRPKLFKKVYYEDVGYERWAKSMLARAEYLKRNRHRIKRSLAYEALITQIERERLDKYSI